MKIWILSILNIFLQALKNFFVKKIDYPFDIEKDDDGNIIAIAADYPFYKDGAFGDNNCAYVTREEVTSMIASSVSNVLTSVAVDYNTIDGDGTSGAPLSVLCDEIDYNDIETFIN